MSAWQQLGGLKLLHDVSASVCGASPRVVVFGKGQEDDKAEQQGETRGQHSEDP